jgi:hypothetical protein
MSKSKIVVDVPNEETIGAKWEEAKNDIDFRTENRRLKEEVERLKRENMYLKGCYDGALGKEPRKIDEVAKDDIGFAEAMKLWKEKGWIL